MKILFLILLLPHLLAALAAGLVRPYRQGVGWFAATMALISLGAALGFAGALARGAAAPAWGLRLFDLGLEDALRVDGLSALILVCVTGVAALTLLIGPGLGGETALDGRQLRKYFIYVDLFIASMLLAVSANNVGLMWIAIEATTIFSAFLLPLHMSKASLEASWKYILICSVGIALAFTGIVLAYFDFVALAGRTENALNWTVLMTVAPTLHPDVMRLAFVFLLVGFGTKAGIAPMHTWKPDAYGEAPAPLAALMASPLFAVAIYAIMRWKAVVDATLANHFTDSLLIMLGLLSLIIAAFSVVLSINYKRMLAYSSIEHTGLICLGLGLGPLGVFAALLHLLNHSAAKALMFNLVGNLERRFPSPLLAETQGVLKALPWTGALFGAGLMALIGLPPGGLFVSEFALFRAGFAEGHPWLMGCVLALLAIIFISFIYHLNAMLYGEPAAGVACGERFDWRLGLMFVSVAVLVTLGLTIPGPVGTLLDAGVVIICGGRGL
jgi:hydrogenase-4 component F